MDKITIIERLARNRSVERLIENISHQSLTADLKDLSQMVYLILLEYDENKIIELYESGEMNFFLVRIILNQYRSTTSTFYYQIRNYAKNAVELTGRDWESE